MHTYIWQNPEYPEFKYNKEEIYRLLIDVKFKLGILSGQISSITDKSVRDNVLKVLIDDVSKSSEIEGIMLNTEELRSSIGQKLGVETINNVRVSQKIQGIVDMTFDAVNNFDKEISENRLFYWHNLMFSGENTGLLAIKKGKYRDDELGEMQVVSGAIGHEKVHYVAPPADILPNEMKKLFDYINNETNTDDIIKAGIVHLWFVINHPFEDGNGRIARALTDMILARSFKSQNRIFSMSKQIQKVRKDYYKALEITQKQSLDITSWLKWFLITLENAIEDSCQNIQKLIFANKFREAHKNDALNERQAKVINKLIGSFEGKLTTSKWAKICKCSQDTATRDISDLIDKGILKKIGVARATHYILTT